MTYEEYLTMLVKSLSNSYSNHMDGRVESYVTREVLENLIRLVSAELTSLKSNDDIHEVGA